MLTYYVRYPDNSPPGKLPTGTIALRLWLGFELVLGLDLGLAAIFIAGNCPTTIMWIILKL